MERMRPPIVPEKPVSMLAEAQLRALLASTKSTPFVDRRDAGIIRLLLDTGWRLSEVAELTVADLDYESDVAHVIGKGRRPHALPFGQQTGLALGRMAPIEFKASAGTPRATRPGCRRRRPRTAPHGPATHHVPSHQQMGRFRSTLGLSYVAPSEPS
jgi:site-specific recombinase XerC